MSRLVRAGQLARLTRMRMRGPTTTTTTSAVHLQRTVPLAARVPIGFTNASLSRARGFATKGPEPAGTGKNKKDREAQDKNEKDAKEDGAANAADTSKETRGLPEQDTAGEIDPKVLARLSPEMREKVLQFEPLSDQDLEKLDKSWSRAPFSGLLRKLGLSDLLRSMAKYGASREFIQLHRLRGPDTSPEDASKYQELLQDVLEVHKELIAAEVRAATESEESARSQGEGKESEQEGEQGGEKGESGKSGPKSKSEGFRIGRLSLYDILVIGLVFGVTEVYLGSIFSPSREITWQEVRRLFLDKGLVEGFVVQEGRVDVHLNKDATKTVYESNSTIDPAMQYYFTIGSVESFEKHLDDAQGDLGIPPSERIPVKYGGKSPWLSILLGFGPTLLLIGLLVYSTRQIGSRAGNQMFGFGKSKAKKFNHETGIKVKFSDVAGMDEAKVEIMEFVSFLKTPEKFRKLGAKIPRGAILAGPPGTGKTLLAKATAGECQVPFFSVSGSEFVEMFVGVGPSRVRDLFSTARNNAPCIIFIDEIDAIGRARMDSKMGGGNDERESTLNQILTEMDGFNTTDQVVVLAGTNRADILDKALMRPGRFDRHIFIDRPTQKGREEIFKVHLRKIVTNEDLDHLVGRLATLTPGFSGADIAHVVNEAALIAARASAESVVLKHFEQAVERTIGGLERKSLILRPEEKKTVAYHEAGHAICGWFLKDADPLLKVSIIPRGQSALGYAQYLPQDVYLMSHKQLMDRMSMTLGGRISEELHFDTVTTGASDDFKKVTQLAMAMVTQWGMSDKVGPLHFEDDSQQRVQKPFAEETGRTIDAEVRRIVDEAYKKAKDLLTEKKREVGLIAEELLQKEMLTRDDLVRILGPRPFGDNHRDFEKYFGGQTGQAPPCPPEETDTPPSTTTFGRHTDADR